MNIDTLYEEVAQEIPTAPRLLIKSKMADTLRCFFDESKLWQHTVPAFPLVAGTARYTLVVPDGTVVARILEVRPAAGGRPLTETPEAKMGLVSQAWRVESGAVAQRYIPELEPGALSVYPIPSDAGQSLVAKVALYPGDAATTIPDWIGQAYRTSFVAGCVGKLQSLSNKPWSEVKEAKRNTDDFEAAVSRARAQVAKSGAHGPTFARLTGFDEL